MKFHCLFEQSGTYKNVFKEKGYTAYDYDILNEYGQTDYVIDLFTEIDNEFNNLAGYGGKQTIFTKMDKNNDFIIAFFPCTHFCNANMLIYKLYNAGKKLPYNINNCKRLIARNQERARYFEIYLKFCYICQQKNIKCIIENPASGGNEQFLKLYSPIPIAFYEKDRSLYGDNFKKPTFYFSINFEMKEEFLMYSVNYNKKNIQKDKHTTRERSEISSLYAENFYKRFLENKI